MTEGGTKESHDTKVLNFKRTVLSMGEAQPL